MTTHFHLVVNTPRANLGRGMQHLNGMYAAQDFNRRHGRKGHLFDGRYGAVRIDRQSHLFEAIRYVALNPVRAGLCEAAEEWIWSSYAASVGLAASPSFLSIDGVLELFASDTEAARTRLRAFVQPSV